MFKMIGQIGRIGLISLIIPQVTTAGEAKPEFRTDANNDESLEWYQIEPGKFPPEGSAHYFAGELIGIDPINRKGALRPDRTDTQRRSHWDRTVQFALLPYAKVMYNGAYAELRDIPLGTHLHGLFYKRDPKAPRLNLPGAYGRMHVEADFSRCFLLEDDFSHRQRLGQAWRVESVNHEENKLEATLLQIEGVDGKPSSVEGKPATFDLMPYTRVLVGNRVTGLKALEKGQLIHFNLTWATLYGRGRITAIWADEEARNLATRHQANVHQAFIKEHGFPGWVEAVDNEQKLVTISLFSNVEPKLYDVMKEGEGHSLLVAEPTLRTYDQVNDRKNGPIVKIEKLDPQPGFSGVQIQHKPDLLLEGYRQGRIVRIVPGTWGLISIPLEERLWP